MAVSHIGSGIDGPDRFCYVAEDITSRKLAEEHVMASERLLLDFVEHAPAAMAMFDDQMRYLKVSNRWVEDYELQGQSLIGRSDYDVFPDSPQRWKDTHAHCLAGAVESSEEDYYQRADGTIQWLRWEVRPWRRPGGSVGGIIIFTEDITGKKLATEEIHAAHAATERANQELQQALQQAQRLTLEANAANEANPPRIIAMTAHAGLEERKRCIASGMDDYLAKPVSLEMLANVLAGIEPSPAASAPKQDHSKPCLDQATVAIIRSLHAHKPGFARTVTQLYISKNSSVVENLARAVVACDYDAAATLAHALKGSSLIIGAMRLGDICMKIEADAKSGSQAELDAGLGAVKQEFNQVCVTLEDEFPPV